MAAFLAGFDTWDALERRAGTGAIVETWIAGELHELIGITDSRMQLHFWRTHTG